MLLYRITKSTYANDLSGEGARLYGGRWNRKGVSMIYTADSPALALLEVLVHLSLTMVPKNYQLVTIQMADECFVKELVASLLPPDWRRVPAPESLADLGSDWAKSMESVALRIPSAIVDGQSNILLNPGYLQFKLINIVNVEPFDFDARLL